MYMFRWVPICIWYVCQTIHNAHCHTRIHNDCNWSTSAYKVTCMIMVYGISIYYNRSECDHNDKRDLNSTCSTLYPRIFARE